MTPDDVTHEAPPRSRRDRSGRDRAASPVDEADETARVLEQLTGPAPQWADDSRTATAFAWVDPDDVAATTQPAALTAASAEPIERDILADAHLRPAVLRAGFLAPLGTVAAAAVAYGATMLLWPLAAITPTVTAADFETTAAAAATVTFPAIGSASVGVDGVSSLASSTDATTIASITKVVTSLMVLDALPLQLGEQGPEYAFTYSDSVDYWNYRRSNQSALDVPVGGVLTEYQLLQGTLMGSANNYIDFLADEIWGSDWEFAAAAESWLAARGLTDITVVTPSGFDEGNVATPDALIRLADTAMQNPVFAEIVGTASVELPGAGLVENTNGMLSDAGVVGIKTGSLVGYNLLTAKDVVIGDTPVRLYAAVLNQDDDAQRLAVTRQLFDEVETALNATAPAVPAGTVVGGITTEWGQHVDVVTDEDADVVLWNGAAATAAVSFDLDDQRDEGAVVGTLTATGPIDEASIDVSLAEELTDPSPWWRLTHPLELLGLAN